MQSILGGSNSQWKLFPALWAIIGLLIILSPTVAHSHSQLIEIDPAADAQLAEAPEEIKLLFNENLIELGNIVMVVDATGKNLANGDPEISGSVMRQPLSELSEGWYRINWRAVSADGHPITGTQLFLVGKNTELPKPELSTATPSESVDKDTDQVQTGEIIRYISLAAIGAGLGFLGFLLATRKKQKPSKT